MDWLSCRIEIARDGRLDLCCGITFCGRSLENEMKTDERNTVLRAIMSPFEERYSSFEALVDQM
jgi:hypothetical protein